MRNEKQMNSTWPCLLSATSLDGFFLNASVVRTEAFVVILVLVRTRAGRVGHLPGFWFLGFFVSVKAD